MNRKRPGENRLLVLRFAAGLLAEGTDVLMDRLERWDSELLTAPDPTHRSPRWRAAALGAMVRVPQQLRAARREFSQELDRKLDLPLVIWLMQRRPIRKLRRNLDRMQRRAKAELVLWERLGRFEESRGRALAKTAIDEVSRSVIHRVASSPEIQEVIREQSTGIAHGLMEHARASSLHADDQVQSAVARFLRRDPHG